MKTTSTEAWTKNRELPFAVHEHAMMLADNARMDTFRRAVARFASRSADFVELGCGTGVFTLYASELYRRAVGIERDGRVLEFGRRAAAKLPPMTSVRFIEADLFEFAERYEGERFDVVLCELLSPWLLREPLISALSLAKRRLLKEDGKMIPSSVRLLLQTGSFDFSFSGIDLYSYHYDFLNPHRFKPLTNIAVAAVIDFSVEREPRFEGACVLEPVVAGVANAVRIMTVAELAPGITMWGTPSIMPDVIVPVVAAREVSVGSVMDLRWSLEFEAGLDSLSFDFSSG